MDLILTVVTFALVVLILLAIVALMGGGRSNVVERRLEAIAKAGQRGQRTGKLKLLREQVPLSAMPLLNSLLLRWNWSERLREFISKAGLHIVPGKLILASAVLGMAMYSLGGYVSSNNFLLSLVLGVAGSLVPGAFVAFKRSQRLRAFEKGFPAAIDLLGRAVRAGHAFTTGLEMVATELTDPVAGEFRITFDEQNVGLPLRDALVNLAKRVPIIDVRFFVTALLIHKETGGNLAQLLDNLSHVIRDRFKLLGEVRIRTAQGRLTAGILIAIPPALIMALRFLNPDYVNPLFTDPVGRAMLIAGVCLQAIGTVILWKIVNIQV